MEDKFEPASKVPDGIDVNWVANAVGWPWPTWVADGLYKTEFAEGDTGQNLVNMFNNLRGAIDKALATELGDDSTIRFKYWRKVSQKATKMKPLHLAAKLWRHPDYDKVWLEVGYQ